MSFQQAAFSEIAWLVTFMKMTFFNLLFFVHFFSCVRDIRFELLTFLKMISLIEALPWAPCDLSASASEDTCGVRGLHQHHRTLVECGAFLPLQQCRCPLPASLGLSGSSYRSSLSQLRISLKKILLLICSAVIYMSFYFPLWGLRNKINILCPSVSCPSLLPTAVFLLLFQ